MRNEFDFAPLYRSSIGFDRVFNLLNNAQRVQAVDTWPPYNIVKAGEDDYRIVIAVAGFGEEDLSVTHERNVLIIAGEKAGKEDAQYLHHGIAGRSFERRFELADHVKVSEASLKNGLLSVELKLEIPEEMKPRRIPIGTSEAQQKQTAPLQIEGGKQVA
ncbi:Hsp20 family protein [Rhizobium beringeri]|jgi:molecular chaperone IbpA|uniref:Hsp20 family protein n=2 Tax=Rhizobium TaxID=379 RepID=A0A444I6Z4_RHILE|nr:MULTISPECIES: Hsp20 family protein [Rhizobium]MBY5461800.1 Hsp20 family protein [Rhizobium leguminosarum]NKL65951.1 Hsp20 family protein [Rhizobium leguminosarum bv. viciae]RWX07146.1 Hsp20 family protein [Rhizobium leguminosarum]RWX33893.1 Hsp20 family protein [Rhizobium leguminosarum]TAU37839.1 Hsp20 family protein [Rhizobium leguminosarum]